MRHRTDAGMGRVELVRVGLGVADELLEVGGRQAVAGHKNDRLRVDQANRLEILQRLVGEVRHQGDRRGVRSNVAEAQRVAVRCGARDAGGAGRAAGAADILDHELLSESLRENVRHDAPGDIGGAAGGERHDQGAGTRRIALRLGGGDAGQHGSETASRSFFIQFPSLASRHW